MATRKIKDAKDLTINELIYFKGHAKATYMSDGSTVEDVINDIKVNGSGNTDLSNYETKVESQNKLQEAKYYTDTAITNLVDSAPETLNTLNELAIAITENQSIIETLDSAITNKQDLLVDNINIKTVNGTSILGSGDITIESGSEQIQSDWNETDTTSKAYIANKPNIYVDLFHNIHVDSTESPDKIGLISESLVSTIGITISMNNITWYGFDESGGTTYTITSSGDGTKFLSDNGTYKSISTAYPQVNHGTSDTTFALTSNILHIWDEVTELSLTLADPTDTTVANEYVFQFTSGATATTLTLPDTIKWLETPSIESDKVYQVSILNNCGTILGFV